MKDIKQQIIFKTRISYIAWLILIFLLIIVGLYGNFKVFGDILMFSYSSWRLSIFLLIWFIFLSQLFSQKVIILENCFLIKRSYFLFFLKPKKNYYKEIANIIIAFKRPIYLKIFFRNGRKKTYNFFFFVRYKDFIRVGQELNKNQVDISYDGSFPPYV